MNEKGYIKRFETPEEAKRSGFNMPLTAEDFERLAPLSPENRVAAHVKAKMRRFKQRAGKATGAQG